MSTTVARRILVGTAVVLVLGGTLLALPGPARAVLLGAGVWCAVLDVVLVRAERDPHPRTEAVLPDGDVVPPTADDGDVVPPTADDGGACGTSPATDASSDSRPRLELGRTTDGVRVAVPADARTHVAVVGTGALALAVHRAVVAQLGTLDGTAELRCTSATDLVEDTAERTTSAVGALPAGTAVAVALRHDGRVRASAVLVPSDGLRPRRADVVVHVTRYGCTVRLPGERQGQSVDPVLPLLPER